MALYGDRKLRCSAIEGWWSTWEKHRSPLALLGEEGDGKTWAAVSWVAGCCATRGAAFVVVTSNLVTHSDPVILLAHLTATLLTEVTANEWEPRIRRWLDSGGVRLVMLLDGLNEETAGGIWHRLLQGLERYREVISVIVTCRRSAWRRFEACEWEGWQRHNVSPFDDAELRKMLEVEGMELESIPMPVWNLMRKPRYFDMARRHYPALVQTADLTVARLIYEDWQDRLRRRPTLGKLDFATEDLQRLIREVAQKNLGIVRMADLSQHIPDLADAKMVLRQLVEEGIFEPDGVGIRLKRNYVVHGLGGILAELARAAAGEGRPIDEEIAGWLEPNAEMDIKGQICGTACLHALRDPSFPEVARVALLIAWFGTQNFYAPVQENVAAYLPLSPSTYVTVAEHFWSRQNDPRAQRILMSGLHRLQLTDAAVRALRVLIERWIALVHPLGSPVHRRGRESADVDLRGEVTRRLGCEPSPGTAVVCDTPVRVLAGAEAGLLRLTRVALALLYRDPRPGELAPALVSWALSRAVNGHCDEGDLARWVMRSHLETLWPALEPVIQRLLSCTSDAGMKAAQWLLELCGNVEARRLIAQHGLGAPPPLQFLRDPWAGLAADALAAGDGMGDDLPTVSECARKLDVARVAVAAGKTVEEFRLQQLLTILARHDPSEAIQLVRRIANTAGDRSPESLQFLLWRFDEHLMALGGTERELLLRLWEGVVTRASEWGDVDHWNEDLLFRALAFGAPSRSQWELLSARPPEAFVSLTGLALLAEPTPQALEEVFQALRKPSGSQRVRCLAFLSSNSFDGSPEDLESLISLTKDPELEVRVWAMRSLLSCTNEAVRAAFVAGPWAWDAEQDIRENLAGGELLAGHAQALQFEEVVRRIPLSMLGTAVRNRQSRPDEVGVFGTLLDELWERLQDRRESGLEDLPKAHATSPSARLAWPCPLHFGLDASLTSPSVAFVAEEEHWGGVVTILTGVADFMNLAGQEERLNRLTRVLREAAESQSQAGNPWFAGYWTEEGLLEVLSLRIDLACKWVGRALHDPSLFTQFPRFYESLCWPLLEVDAALGANLHHAYVRSRATMMVDARTGWPAITHALFRSQSTADAALNERRAVLDGCQSDRELLRLAVVAQLEGNDAWLAERTEELLASGRHADVARGVALSCFRVDDGPRGLRLPNGFQGSWVGDFGKGLFLRHTVRDDSARAHFRRFVGATDPADLWASFRLFLRSVDSRYHLWGPDVLEQATGDRFLCTSILELNGDELQRNIQKQEEELGKTFLGMPVLRDPVWPWACSVLG